MLNLETENLIVIKSYGYGIMTIKIIDHDVTGRKVEDVIVGIFPGAQEWIQKQDDSNQIVIMIDKGHIPSKYELGQLDSEDLEWIRNSVNEHGSSSFLNRFTMLESCLES